MGSNQTHAPSGSLPHSADINARQVVDRFRLALERQGLVDLTAVRSLSDSELLSLRGVGPRGLAELRRHDHEFEYQAEGQAGSFAEAARASVAHLTERERLVIERLYGLDGVPPEAATTLGRRLDRSAGRIRVLRDQALRRMTTAALWPIILPALSRVVFERAAEHRISPTNALERLLLLIGPMEMAAAHHLIDDLLRVRAPLDATIAR